ncbi:hypothetical protein [Andreprevotia lacus]|nr:hypothetical protein [Andreprevotia lacus]
MCRDLAAGKGQDATADAELRKREDPWGNHYRLARNNDGSMTVASHDYAMFDGRGRASVVCIAGAERGKAGCDCRIVRTAQ